MFARFKDEENIKAVERLLNSHTELEMFERSQLGISPLLLIHRNMTYIMIDIIMMRLIMDTNDI